MTVIIAQSLEWCSLQTFFEIIEIYKDFTYKNCFHRQLFLVDAAKEHFNQCEMTLLFYTEIHTEKKNKQEITVKESILGLTVIVT